MTDRSSRHANAATYRADDAARGSVELFQPRLREKAAAATQHVVTGADRLDLLAWTYLGDPHQYWRIADANPEVDVERLPEPGRVVQIPGRPS